jgi:NAD(P)-dependent dehydrogenase (short-subunit alcohol dehydrogenase family)
MDRVAIVTGASSGIGRAIAHALGAEAISVVLAARREHLLRELASELDSQTLVVPTDMADQLQVRRLVDATVERWGRIDLVIGNAGIWHHASIEATEPSLWEEMIRVDYLANVWLTLAALPHMGSGSHIIFINSLAGFRGVPSEAPYAAAKHALAGFSSVARQELRSRGISVTSVHPGRVDTAPFESLRVPMVQQKQPPEVVAKAVLSAIHRPRPHIYVPAVRGRLYAWFGLLAPRVFDALARPFKLEGELD